MSYSSINFTNEKLNDLLAQARAIRFAMNYNALSYEEAKRKSEALLRVVNAVVKQYQEDMDEDIQKLSFQICKIFINSQVFHTLFLLRQEQTHDLRE